MNEKLIQVEQGFGLRRNEAIKTPAELRAFLQRTRAFTRGKLHEAQRIEAEILPRAWDLRRVRLHPAIDIQHGLPSPEIIFASLFIHTDNHPFTVCGTVNRGAATGEFSRSGWVQAQIAGLEALIETSKWSISETSRHQIKEEIERLKTPETKKTSDGIRLGKMLHQEELPPKAVIAYQNAARKACKAGHYVETRWSRPTPSSSIKAVQWATDLRHFRAVHTETDFHEVSRLVSISALPTRN